MRTVRTAGVLMEAQTNKKQSHIRTRAPNKGEVLMTTVAFTVNGKHVSVEVDPDSRSSGWCANVSG